MEEDYTPHWMILKNTLDTVLTQTPGTYKPISYEQMYSAVYKCVCKHHSETLHMDLIQHVEGILKNWSQNLESHVRKEDRHNFICEVDSIMNQYFNALSSIVPIFTYLNRFYIESRLNTNLNSQLLHLFEKQITSPYINQILGCLESANPLVITPATVQKIVKSLHSLNCQYSTLNPALFAKYMPGINQSMTEEDLQSQIMAERELQQQLRAAGFDSGNQSRKRPNSDENEARSS